MDIIIATDGSADVNTKRVKVDNPHGGYATVIKTSVHVVFYGRIPERLLIGCAYNNGIINFNLSDEYAKPTNNRGELYGVLVALVSCLELSHRKQISSVTIYCDSKYCINIFTNYIENWKANDRIKSQKNPDLIVYIDTLLTNLKAICTVTFMHQKAHQSQKAINALSEPQKTIALLNATADTYAKAGKDQSEYFKSVLSRDAIC